MNGDNVSWLQSLNSRGIRPGLDNIRALLEELGDPQDSLRIIHVAGSDGKGSVCSMVESMMRASGMQTGMFTSPHVMKVNESIRIDGKDISDEDLDHFLGKVRVAMDSIQSGCTQFETLTACAFLCFADKKVDFAIIEVGMGGRLDSTNVVKPEVTVINNISLEHRAYLGDTIEAIASEKAGIMKPGIPCVTINQDAALRAIKERSAEVGCPLSTIDPEEIDIVSETPDHVQFRYECRNYEIGLAGSYQARNAALAIAAISKLSDSARILPFAHIGLHSIEWPYRMQRLEGTSIMIDPTHTRTGAEYLRKDISGLYGKVILVTGMLNDKDLDGVAKELSAIASEVHVSSPDSPRAADRELLASHYRKYHDDVTVHETVSDALDSVVGKDGLILVTGSFRTVEDCLRWQRRIR